MLESIKYVSVGGENHPLDASYLGGKLSDNYYTKDLTYSKEEIDSMIEQLPLRDIISVDTLPQASANTVGKMYLISNNGDDENTKDEYITLYNYNKFSWEKIGSTEVNLEGYVTEEYMDGEVETINQIIEENEKVITASLNDLNTRIGSLENSIDSISFDLSSYYTKSQTYSQTEVDSLLDTKCGIILGNYGDNIFNTLLTAFQTNKKIAVMIQYMETSSNRRYALLYSGYDYTTNEYMFNAVVDNISITAFVNYNNVWRLVKKELVTADNLLAKLQTIGTIENWTFTDDNNQTYTKKVIVLN